MPQAPIFVDVTMNIRTNSGPKWNDGGVILLFRNADAFDFVSKANWPKGSNADSSILDGVKEGFIQALGYIPACQVTLSAIEYHPINSCASGFQTSARYATLAACGL